ncbi:hypothetical protein ACLIBH_03870 [Virgibacillus sp. W0430]|uniref:hypothetical protein n=1 Tax=Virgibacillus sp. W0430 TaxID=3391580 RepID=UPI003F47FD5A
MSWIKTEHFPSLGITEEHLIFAIVFSSTCIFFLLFYPLVNWFISQKLQKMITYIISSLFVVVIYLLLIVMNEMFHVYFLKIILQAISFFGLFVVGGYLFLQVKRKFTSH